jgi:hypothetical protein
VGLSATPVPAAAAAPLDTGAIVVPAADVAAPSEFAAVLRCYIPLPEEDGERSGRFTRLNMALRGGPPYRDAEGARSWWAW